MPRSLDILQGQPIRFDFDAETCANNDNRAYCNLVQNGDTVQFQGRRILGTDISCDFTEVDATQLFANSGFTGSAASWNLTGGWAYGANDVAIAAGSGSVTQNLTLVDMAVYKIIVVTTATSTGGVNVLLSSTTIGTIPDGSLAGTYTFYGIADTGAGVACGVQGTTITTTVTSVEIYRVSPCMTVEVIDGSASYDTDGGLQINGTVSITLMPTWEPSSKYSPKTTISVTNFIAGTVDFSFDATSSGALEGTNGDTSWTLNGDDPSAGIGISFVDYTGVLTNITIEQLSSDYYFALYDIDGVYVQSLNSFVTYCRDFVNLSFDPQAEGFAYGCYKIGLYDPYLHSDQIEYEYTDFSGFTTTGSTWDISNPGADFDAASNTNASIRESETASSFQVAWIKFRVETGDNTGTGVGTSTLEISTVDTTAVATIGRLSFTSEADADTYYGATAGNVTLTYGPNLDNYVSITAAETGDHYEFVNAYYIIYPYHVDYYSNCFNYKEEHPCSKMVYALPGANIGFDSDCSFAIAQRFRILRITPTYKITQSSDFISSDSTRTLISGTGMKFYTLMFDYMDEVSHDVVMTLILSKEIYIAEDYTNITNLGKRYFILPQDYTPEWEKDGKLNLAMGRILIMEQDQVKFTTNCG